VQVANLPDASVAVQVNDPVPGTVKAPAAAVRTVETTAQLSPVVGVPVMTAPHFVGSELTLAAAGQVIVGF